MTNNSLPRELSTTVEKNSQHFFYEYRSLTVPKSDTCSPKKKTIFSLAYFHVISPITTKYTTKLDKDILQSKTVKAVICKLISA